MHEDVRVCLGKGQDGQKKHESSEARQQPKHPTPRDSSVRHESTADGPKRGPRKRGQREQSKRLSANICVPHVRDDGAKIMAVSTRCPVRIREKIVEYAPTVGQRSCGECPAQETEHQDLRGVLC